MIRALAAALILLVAFVAAPLGAEETLDSETCSAPLALDDAGDLEMSLPEGQPTAGHSIQVAQACCKVCRTGKACGNSCISRNYNCTKPKGCACDG